MAEQGPDAVGLLERVSLCTLTENLSYIEPEFILLTVHQYFEGTEFVLMVQDDKQW
jgi:hypothetical protein